MVNTQLLDAKIKESGLKSSYISDTLGISRQAFNNKRTNKSPFRGAEMFALSMLLKMTEQEKARIFFAE